MIVGSLLYMALTSGLEVYREYRPAGIAIWMMLTGYASLAIPSVWSM